MMLQFRKTLIVALLIMSPLPARAQSPNDAMKPLPTPSVPAGPRPTATVTPLQASPQPTTTITPLPSASPSGTQPQTTNTMTPSPSPGR
ncbi:MAG TPA: hypothetical protein VGF73_07000 [Chthoniobacterales bacterium]